MRLYNSGVSQRAPLRYPPGLAVQPGLPDTAYDLNNFTSKCWSIANNSMNFAECIISSTMYWCHEYAGTPRTPRQYDCNNASGSYWAVSWGFGRVMQGIDTLYSCLRTWYIFLHTFWWYRANYYQAQWIVQHLLEISMPCFYGTIICSMINCWTPS